VSDNNLRPRGTDFAVALSKGVLGGIPYIGPLAAEVVGTIIPNQRVDRLQRFLDRLEIRIRNLEAAGIRARFMEPGFVDLLEDAMYQAARALSDERLDHIAALIKNGLTKADSEMLQYKHLLSILGQLNDVELIKLCSHARRFQRDEGFRSRHAGAIYSSPVHSLILSHRSRLDTAGGVVRGHGRSW
jgi:hypothetical protein